MKETKKAIARPTNAVIRDAVLKYKNFSGTGSKYNAEGNRVFRIILEDDLAEAFENRGWYVAGKEGEERSLKVHVSYRFDGPIVKIYTRKNGKLISVDNKNEDDIGDLDRLELNDVSVVLTPSYWEDGEKYIPYLRELRAIIDCSPLDIDLYELDESAATDEPIDEDDDLPF